MLSLFIINRQTARISALSQGNVSKYEFLTSKDILLEKDLLEQAATMKRFEYSPLGKELKAQTDIAKKQYQKLDIYYKFGKESIIGKYNKYLILYITVIIVFTHIIVIPNNLIVFLLDQSIHFHPNF